MTDTVSPSALGTFRSKRQSRRKEKVQFTYTPPKSFTSPVAVRILIVVILIFALLYFVFPIYWMLISATKSPGEMVSSNGLWFAVPLSEIPSVIAHNYNLLIDLTRGYFWRWVGNSFFYSTTAAAIGTIASVMAGYATSKYTFRGKNAAIGVVMASMLMPGILFTVPIYGMFQSVGLDNTALSLIVPCCCSPFGFFLGRVYADNSVPKELLEAARIDGAGEIRIFFTIVLRILAPAMVTIFLMMFVGTWNNFMLPLMMVSSDELRPITLALYGMVSLPTFDERGVLIMAAILGVIPLMVIFLALQRFWQAGLTAGSVKA